MKKIFWLFLFSIILLGSLFAFEIPKIYAYVSCTDYFCEGSNYTIPCSDSSDCNHCVNEACVDGPGATGCTGYSDCEGGGGGGDLDTCGPNWLCVAGGNICVNDKWCNHCDGESCVIGAPGAGVTECSSNDDCTGGGGGGDLSSCINSVCDNEDGNICESDIECNYCDGETCVPGEGDNSQTNCTSDDQCTGGGGGSKCADDGTCSPDGTGAVCENNGQCSHCDNETCVAGFVEGQTGCDIEDVWSACCPEGQTKPHLVCINAECTPVNSCGEDNCADCTPCIYDCPSRCVGDVWQGYKCLNSRCVVDDENKTDCGYSKSTPATCEGNSITKTVETGVCVDGGCSSEIGNVSIPCPDPQSVKIGPNYCCTFGGCDTRAVSPVCKGVDICSPCGEGQPGGSGDGSGVTSGDACYPEGSTIECFCGTQTCEDDPDSEFEDVGKWGSCGGHSECNQNTLQCECKTGTGNNECEESLECGGCIPDDIQPCGDCGVQFCSATGIWGVCLEHYDCVETSGVYSCECQTGEAGSDTCIPGEECGSCTEPGETNPHSECVDGVCTSVNECGTTDCTSCGGGCTPGDTEDCEPCGTRTCDSNGAWSNDCEFALRCGEGGPGGDTCNCVPAASYIEDNCSTEGEVCFEWECYNNTCSYQAPSGVGPSLNCEASGTFNAPCCPDGQHLDCNTDTEMCECVDGEGENNCAYCPDGQHSEEDSVTHECVCVIGEGDDECPTVSQSCSHTECVETVLGSGEGTCEVAQGVKPDPSTPGYQYCDSLPGSECCFAGTAKSCPISAFCANSKVCSLTGIWGDCTNFYTHCDNNYCQCEPCEGEDCLDTCYKDFPCCPDGQHRVCDDGACSDCVSCEDQTPCYDSCWNDDHCGECDDGDTKPCSCGGFVICIYGTWDECSNHTECLYDSSMNYICQCVDYAGYDECNGNDQCNACETGQNNPHYECVSGACASVDTCGVDDCDDCLTQCDQDFPEKTLPHYECVGDSCELLYSCDDSDCSDCGGGCTPGDTQACETGCGTQTCQTGGIWSNCSEHTDCNLNSGFCECVAGVGDDDCLLQGMECCQEGDMRFNSLACEYCDVQTCSEGGWSLDCLALSFYKQCDSGLCECSFDSGSLCESNNECVENQPPYVENMSVSSSLNCGYQFGSMNFSWTYRDLEGDYEMQFTFQISDSDNFDNPIYSATVGSSQDPLIYPDGATNNQQIFVKINPTAEELGYNTDYYWRVKVKEENTNFESGWFYAGSPVQYQYSHPAPVASYVFDPQNPASEDEVTFADGDGESSYSTCYDVQGGDIVSFDCKTVGNNVRYNWWFGDGDPAHTYSAYPDSPDQIQLATDPNKGQVKYTYTTASSRTYATTMEICDQDNYCCHTSKDVSVGQEGGLPKWKEISPF